jgi:hypothetical protein
MSHKVDSLFWSSGKVVGNMLITKSDLFGFMLKNADEQERVQKKTFVNWINSYLSKVSNYYLDCLYGQNGFLEMIVPRVVVFAFLHFVYGDCFSLNIFFFFSKKRERMFYSSFCLCQGWRL